MNNPYNVKPGQIWVDNDYRTEGKRKIIVQRINSRYAYCLVLGTSRKTRISLIRFNNKSSTGYTLKNDRKTNG